MPRSLSNKIMHLPAWPQTYDEGTKPEYAHCVGHKEARRQAADVAGDYDDLLTEMEKVISDLLVAMRLAGWDDDAIAEKARKTLDHYNELKERDK